MSILSRLFNVPDPDQTFEDELRRINESDDLWTARMAARCNDARTWGPFAASPPGPVRKPFDA